MRRALCLALLLLAGVAVGSVAEPWIPAGGECRAADQAKYDQFEQAPCLAFRQGNDAYVLHSNPLAQSGDYLRPRKISPTHLGSASSSIRALRRVSATDLNFMLR